MPTRAPNFNQDPWSIDAPTEPGTYLFRRGDMITNAEVTQTADGLMVAVADGEPRDINQVASPYTEWQRY